MFNNNNSLSLGHQPTDFPFEVKKHVHTERRIQRYSINVDSKLTEKLLGICKQSNLSLYVFLITILKVTLFRLVRNTEILIASPTLSDYIPDEINKDNIIIIQDIVNNNLTFRQLLTKTGEDVLKANRNSMSIKESAVAQRYTLALSNVNNINILDDLIYDILMIFTNEEDGLSLIIRYNESLIEKERAVDFVNRYFLLLEQTLNKADEKISNYSILYDYEKDELFGLSRDLSVPQITQAVYELFEKQAEANPDAYALYYDNTYMTYGDLNIKANQLAHALIQKGLKKMIL